MRITCLTMGSYGDVLPIVALGLGLKQAGHTVKIAAKSYFSSKQVDYKPLVTKWDLEYAALKYDFDSLENGFLEELWNLCQNTDAIIFTEYIFLCGYIAAEKLKVPCYMVCVSPAHPTSVFPCPSGFNLPFVKSLNNKYNCLSYSLNRLSYFLSNYGSWQAFRLSINQWRRKVLQLPPLSRWSGILGPIRQKQIPSFYIHSPALLPKPSDWSDWIHVTGYWFLNDSVDWQPSQDLIKFLAKGSPPVYIGFGLFNQDDDSKSLIELQLEALKRSAQRGILLIRKDLRNLVELPDEVLPVEWVSFEWLFPKVSAVVHHGGLGTIHAALRAGTPSIIVSHDNDNFFWGYQLAKLGLGPLPIRREQLSVEKLTAAIKTAISNKAMQARVAQMSKQIEAEDGVQRAVEIFHSYL
jgi:sterol 3beta-glucosyltransferase